MTIIIFAIFCIFIIIFILTNYFEYLDKHSWIPTVISILVAAFAILFTWGYDKHKHEKDQEKLLKTILLELDYIAGVGIMTVASLERNSLLHWYEETYNSRHLPSHPIKEIDVDGYAQRLDYEINGKSTMKVKQALYWVNDCIKMLNYNTNILIGIELSDSAKEYKEEQKRRIIPLIKQPISRLEILCSYLKTLIEERFGVGYNRDG